MARKSRTVLEAENKVLRRVSTTQAIASVLNNLIRWGGLVIISYWIYLSVTALAGKSTMADIGVTVFADIRASEVLSWIFGIGGIGYGWRQKSLRQDTTERLQGRIKAFETEKDPNRSTSGLTERGMTHPKDNQ